MTNSLSINIARRIDAIPRDARAARPPNTLGFGLFLLLNAVLFIRPAEIVSDLESWPIYAVIIVACLIASWQVLIDQLQPAALLARPTTLCVIGLLVAVVLSHLSHANLLYARLMSLEFAKVVLYFLLLTGLVDSPTRLRIFVATVGAYIIVMAGLSVLQYHGAIQIDALKPLEEGGGVDGFGDPLPGNLRLLACGIFHDPNDFSLVLGTAMLVLTFLFFEQRGGALRLACLLPLPLLAYAFALTQSRGGFLGMIAGFATFGLSRWPWRRSLPLIVLLAPLALLAFGGRQTNIDLNDSSDTAQGRILIWRDGLAVFRPVPLFGIGQGLFEEAVGHSAHNSYIHCYVEMGFFGGSIFVGAFVTALMSLRQVRRSGDRLDAQLARWQPCILAVLVCYIVGINSLSRSYVVPTYLILGLAAAYCSIAARQVPSIIVPASARLLARIAVTGVLVLFGFSAFIRIMAR